MQGPPKHNRQPNKAQERRGSRCVPSCCARRLSDSSVDELECGTARHRHPPVSSPARKVRQGKRVAGAGFAVMVAMEKCSSDPREDFRSSMVEMIVENWIEEPKDLRYLLKCYVEMNAEEHRAIILETFYEVCSRMFKS